MESYPFYPILSGALFKSITSDTLILGQLMSSLCFRKLMDLYHLTVTSSAMVAVLLLDMCTKKAR